MKEHLIVFVAVVVNFQHSDISYLFSILSFFQVYSASPIFGVEFETEEKVFIILSFLIYNL